MSDALRRRGGVRPGVCFVGVMMSLLGSPRSGLRRVGRLAGLFVHSRIFPAAAALFALLMVLLAIQTGFNVGRNNLYGGLMNAVEQQQAAIYSRLAVLLVCVFLLLTLVDVVFTFVEERLGLLLRRGLTQHLIETYLGNRAYLRLMDRPDVDNPDQRITDDVKALAANALSLLLIVLRSVVNIVVFAVVLYRITPLLVWAAAGYAVFGSVVTLLIGKRLIRLQIDQLHKEADLRFELVRTRENATAIALQRDEARQRPQLIDRLTALVFNFRLIIVRNAFLNLFTKSFAYLVVIVPVLIVAPLVIRDETKMGTLIQSVEAFQFVVNGLSVLITEFPRLANLSAAAARLGELVAAVAAPPRKNGITFEVDGDVLAVQGLTLVDPGDGHRYFAGLNLEVRPGGHLLIVGRPGSGKSELTQALAGLWPTGYGKVIRPPLDRVAFVPPEPYLTPVSLRDLLAPDPESASATAEGLREALAAVELTDVVDRVGGLDRARDWNTQLSLNERQALALARLLVTPPKFAVIDEAIAALDAETRVTFYQRLDKAGVTIVTLAPRRILAEFHSHVVVLPGGSASQAPTAA